MGLIDHVRDVRAAHDAIVAEAQRRLGEAIIAALHAGEPVPAVADAARFRVDQVARIGIAAGIPASANVYPDQRTSWNETLAAADDPQQRERLARLPADARPLPTITAYDDLFRRPGVVRSTDARG